MNRQTIEKGIRRYTDSGGKITYHVRAERGGKVRHGTAPNIKHARELRSKFMLELAEAADFPERKKIEPIRLRDFADQYVERYLKVNAPKSWRKAKNRVDNIVKILGENIIVSSIEVRNVEDMLKTLEKRGDSAGTRNRYRARLRSMLKQAIRWGYMFSNPVEEVDSLTEPKLGDRYLQPHELTELLDACDSRLKPLVQFAAATGLRQGEILAIRWSDIDRETQTVSVRHEISKTSTARVVPLNKDALEALESCSLEDPIFGWERFPSELWAKAMKELGWHGDHIDPRIKNWRFHDLRHSCTSWLVMNDVPIQKVARILGHRDISTTMRYSHLADDSLAGAMASIETGKSRARGKTVPISKARKPA